MLKFGVVFQLRDEHMRAFQAVAEDNFEQRAVLHLRTYLPEPAAASSDDELRGRVRSGEARARHYGFRSERQIMCFVDTMFLLGPRFDASPQHAWARQILNNDKATPDQRAGTLLDQAERLSGYRKPARRKPGP